MIKEELEQIIDALEYRLAQLEDLTLHNFEQIDKKLLLAHGTFIRPKADAEGQRSDMQRRRNVYYKLINKATTRA